MIFTKTKLKGSFIIELEKQEDERGFFTRTWDYKKFKQLGLNPKIVQCNISFTKKKGTLRGMHYQIAPYEEAKLIRCIKGSIFDVIIDLRPKSRTFKKWTSVELNAEDYKMLYVPEGFAHGFITLKHNTEVFYQMSEIYMPKYSHGILWNDPAFRIAWPSKPTVISKRDLSFSLFQTRKRSNY